MKVELSWKQGRAPEDLQKILDEFAEVVGDELLAEWDALMETIRERVQDLAPVDTGRLRDSYEEMVETIKQGIRGKVETTVPYAPFQEFLEYGIAHLGPAFEESKPRIEKHIETAWNRAVNEVS